MAQVTKKTAEWKLALCMSAMVVVIFELALRFLWPISDPFERYKRSEYPHSYFRSINPPNNIRYTEAEEGLPGISGRNRIVTNNMGFRGPMMVIPKPKDEFRVIMVGGSSTECVYIDEDVAIHTVLGKKLNELIPNQKRVIKVYNAGISGDRSDDHIALLTQRIGHLEPDVIILLMGINDLLAAMNGFDYLHFNQDPILIHGKNLLYFALTEFQVPRRIYYAIKKMAGESTDLINMPSRSDYRIKHTRSLATPETEDRPTVNLKAYENNLRTMGGLLKAHGVRLIFVTQQSTWNSTVDPSVKDWYWMLAIGGKRYQDKYMDDALRSYNVAMKNVAKELSTPVFDLEKYIPRSLEYFYDDVHFTVKGGQYAAQELASFMVKEKLY